ncbi:MAG: hypothetical protein AAF657_17210 [Acidobacteriota bacterium]
MYLLLAMVIFFVGLPITKSFLQEMSIGQDIRRIDTEYSLHGAKYFRERLDEIILRSTLDPKRVAIQVQENQRTAKVLVEVRYLSRLNIVVFPLEREVVVREEIPLVPL